MVVRFLCWCVLLLVFAPLVAGNSLNGLPAKFRNLSNRKVHLYWVNHDGLPTFSWQLDELGGETSFQTYAGHRFFYAHVPVDGAAPKPITGNGARGAAFKVRKDQLIYTFIDNDTPQKLVDQLEEELEYMTAYYQTLGRHWLAYYPRDPPVFPMWSCDYIGQTHSVTLSPKANHLSCEKANCLRRAPMTLQLVCISQKPRAFTIANFLSNFECGHIISSVLPYMKNASDTFENALKESPIEGTLSGITASSTSDRITREGVFADTIFRRVAEVFRMPEEVFWHDRNVESFNVLHYLKGEEYTPHYDWGSHGGAEARFLSMVLYFNTPKKGGATSFPLSQIKNGSDYLKVKAKKQSAVFFYNLLEDGNVDEYSLHAGEAVEKGNKWSGVLWAWDPHVIGGRSPHDVIDRLERDKKKNPLTLMMLTNWQCYMN